MYEQPDWTGIHRELARVGVTLRILHGEYADECASAGRPRMGRDRFRKQHAAYAARTGVTSGVEHRAGRAIEVDLAGKTIRIVDPVTGDESGAYLFVDVPPTGRYAFVEPTPDMGQNAWLRCHVAMHEWFGGSTPRLVCDRLRTGVISHPREGEVVLDDAYRSMAEHHSAAVIPGRVRRPKDKPSAENTAWHTTMALAGVMRDRSFGSLDELRAAVRAWLDECNSRPFRERDGSRRSVFESEERPLPTPLPETAYEVADWIYGRKARPNCHVAYARNWCSVPYAYAGATVDLRVGAGTIEAWHRGSRLCTHRSCHPRPSTSTAQTRPTCSGRPYRGNGTGNTARSGRGGSARTAPTPSGGCSLRTGSTTSAGSTPWSSNRSEPPMAAGYAAATTTRTWAGERDDHRFRDQAQTA